MSPEWLIAAGTLGTFVVIAASAVAALMQLRHMRSSNQIAALTEIRQTIESVEFQDALRFIFRELSGRLTDPEVRKDFASGNIPNDLRDVRLVANFFGNIGLLVRTGFVDERIVCYLWYPIVIRSWDALAPVVTNLRVLSGLDIWENFEYLTVRCKRWLKEHPAGFYPPGVERLPPAELWPETQSKGASNVT